MRSPKEYRSNIVNFRCDDFLSKPEIRQYLGKLYGIESENLKTINKMGKLMRGSPSQSGWRRKDWKKANVTVGFDVDPEYQKIM